MKMYRHHTAVDVIDLDDRTGHWIAVEKKDGKPITVGQMAMSQRATHTIRGSYTIEDDKRYSFYWNDDAELVFRTPEDRRFVLLRLEPDGHLTDLMPKLAVQLLPASYGDGRAIAHMSTFRLVEKGGATLFEANYDYDRYLQYYLGNFTFVPDEDLSDWDFFVAVKRAIEELKLIARAALGTAAATGADAPLLAETGTPCPRAGMWVVVDRIHLCRQLDPRDEMPGVGGASVRWVWVGESA